MNKEAIKIDVQEIETCRKEVKVEVPQKEVKAAYESTLNVLKTRVNLPGFRPGKAPKALILKKFNKEIEDQVRQDIFRAVMETMFEDEANSPVSQPEIDEAAITQNADFSFSMKFDVSPSIEMPDYKSMAIEKAEFKQDDKAVEEQLEEIRQRYAKLEVVDRVAEEDDFVKCSFEGTIDVEEGTEIPDSAQGVLKGEGRWIPVKEQSLLPNALAGLKGKKAGEEVSWEGEFEDAYPVEFLQNKKVTYTCKIDEVHGRVVPELNDELAKQAGAESVEDLKSKLLESQKQQHDVEEINKNKELILDKLVDGFECELPPTLLKAEIDRQQHSLMHEKGIKHDCNTDHEHKHGEDCGHSEEDIKAEEELNTEAEEKAKRELKTRFLLRKIAKAEEVKVEDYELQYQIYMMAQQFRVDPKIFAKQLQENGSIEEFKEQILIDKTLGKIVEINSPKEESKEEVEK